MGDRRDHDYAVFVVHRVAFLANLETDVLPIRMWSMLESTLDVRTAAVSGVPIATTALFVLIMDRVAGPTRRLT